MRDRKEGFVDVWVESCGDHLYRWCALTPGELYRIKTLKDGSRDPLRGKKRRLMTECAAQLFRTNLTYVFFDTRFNLKVDSSGNDAKKSNIGGNQHDWKRNPLA